MIRASNPGPDLPEHHGALYQATDPASLDGAQRAAAIAKASGKPMQFVEVPLAQYRQGLEAAQLRRRSSMPSATSKRCGRSLPRPLAGRA